MNKLTLKFSLLAFTLFSFLAFAPRTASATPPQDGYAFELGHVRLCVGEVERSTDCDFHVRGESGATPTEVAAAKPSASPQSWTMLPIPGFTMCFGDVPPLLALACDFNVDATRSQEKVARNR